MRVHNLVAAALALSIFIVCLIAADLYARGLEDRYIHALAPQMFPLKNQGSALQRAAFSQSDLLPIYGSSELDIADPYHGSQLFKSYPTGFTIFPVGKAGTTDLMILQDLVAIGPSLRGKKVAISLSPPWFFGGGIGAPAYAGNFSRLHANELAFSTELSFDVKHDAAKRMLQFPKTLENDPLLKLALEQLANGSPASRALYYALLPLGKLQTLVLDLQDHWETLNLIWQKTGGKQPLNPNVPRDSAAINWSSLLRVARRQQIQHASNNPFGFDDQSWQRTFRRMALRQKNSRNDIQFEKSMNQSAEWTDLTLLLRGLKEMGAKPLILSMPIQGTYYNYLGVSARARQTYYQKLEKICGSYDVPLLDFANHDTDKYFLIDPGAHVSREGWIFYDQALNSFYHNTLGKVGSAG